jgi:hypothetical protein
MHLHAVADVASWLAGVSECARNFDRHVLNINAALRRLAIKVISKACRECRKQQLAPVYA